MTSKHTPGPWTANKIYGDWNVYSADDDDTIAAVHSEDNQKANAYLIAAAPDMLAAAVKALAFLDHLDNFTGHAACEIARADLRRAIDMAKGGR